MEPVPTDGLRELLKENLELAKENNRLLKAMRRDALIGGIVKTLIWVVLIVISFYFSMKFLEPYLGMLEGVSKDGTDYGALFEDYKALLGQ
jgi:hypothetical protein